MTFLKELAVAAFATKLVELRSKVVEEGDESLRAVGYSDAEIVEISSLNARSYLPTSSTMSFASTSTFPRGSNGCSVVANTLHFPSARPLIAEVKHESVSASECRSTQRRLRTNEPDARRRAERGPSLSTRQRSVECAQRVGRCRRRDSVSRRRHLFTTNGGHNRVSSFTVQSEGNLRLIGVEHTGNEVTGKSGTVKSLAYSLRVRRSLCVARIRSRSRPKSLIPCSERAAGSACARRLLSISIPMSIFVMRSYAVCRNTTPSACTSITTLGSLFTAGGSARSGWLSGSVGQRPGFPIAGFFLRAVAADRSH